MGKFKEEDIERLNNLDFDTEILDEKQALKEILDKQSVLIEELNSLKSLLTPVENVNKTKGRKKSKLYFDDKEITDADLLYLKDVIGMSLGDISRKLKYIDENNNIVTDKNKCRYMIINRINKERKKQK